MRVCEKTRVRIYFKAFGASNWCAKLRTAICQVEWAVNMSESRVMEWSRVRT